MRTNTLCRKPEDKVGRPPATPMGHCPDRTKASPDQRTVSRQGPHFQVAATSGGLVALARHPQPRWSGPKTSLFWEPTSPSPPRPVIPDPLCPRTAREASLSVQGTPPPTEQETRTAFGFGVSSCGVPAPTRWSSPSPGDNVTILGSPSFSVQERGPGWARKAEKQTGHL